MVPRRSSGLLCRGRGRTVAAVPSPPPPPRNSGPAAGLPSRGRGPPLLELGPLVQLKHGVISQNALVQRLLPPTRSMGPAFHARSQPSMQQSHSVLLAATIVHPSPPPLAAGIRAQPRWLHMWPGCMQPRIKLCAHCSVAMQCSFPSPPPPPTSAWLRPSRPRRATASTPSHGARSDLGPRGSLTVANLGCGRAKRNVSARGMRDIGWCMRG